MKSVKKIKTKKAVSKKPAKETKRTAGKEGQPAGEKGKKTYNVLRGMHDILPKEEKYWKACYKNADSLADFFQYNRIETPLLEEAGLFVRSIGRGTDVVEKEMYVFEDRDGDKVCLRPEATAAIARAYISHGMWNLPQPIKVWYWGPMFRHDRPQAGRYREFFQVGYEVLGAADPAIDAELMLIAYNFYRDMGLPVEVHVNSIGNTVERERYRTELLNYYRSKRAYLCEDCKQRLSRNPLRLLDCKQPQCQPVKEEAPKMIDYLEPESKNHFMKVLEFLDELSIPYVMDATLVRGLDYYNNTVFEVYPVLSDVAPGDGGESKNILPAQSALGGGGRYDGLVEGMGGKATPAAGMALGIDRSILAWKQYNEANKITVSAPPCDVFFAQLGDEAKRVALRLIDSLRNTGLRIGFNFFKTSLKNQLEAANNLKVPHVLILGQKEVQDGTVIVRDMESGVQEIIDQKKIENIIKKKLGKA